MGLKEIRQREAETALRSYALEVTVLVNPREDPRDIGSGVLLHRNDGRLFVLTAAHLVEDGNWSPLAIGASAPTATYIRNAVTAVHLAPERSPGQRIDVAILELSTDAQQRLHKIGASISCITSDNDLTEEDFIVITGYACNWMALMEPLRQPDGMSAAKLAAVNIFFITRLEGRDDYRRLRVAWGDAVSDNDRPPPPHIPWKQGERVNMGSPVGVSGAGLWRCRLPREDEVWSPRKVAELVGVNSAWNERDREIVEGVSLWRTWFDDIVKKL